MEKERFKIERKNGIGAEAIEVITDTETGVQYLFFSINRGAGLTLLVDREGKPLINENYK